MVHTPINQSASSERQKVIDWLQTHNYPALPVAPAQDAWKYYKVGQAKPKQGVWSHCPLTADLQPIPLYTGKNPSYLDHNGIPHLLNHRHYRKRLPQKNEIDVWFANPLNGVGTLGGWNNTVWLDFDVKQFPSQQECDAAVSSILSLTQLQQTFIERSHSGGWRIGVKVKQKPDFTNFSLTPGGSHVGEALFEGRFTVLAPTIGTSGNPYQSIQRTFPVEVESLESIGIYSTKSKGTGDKGLGKTLPLPQSLIPSPQSPGSIPLEMLGNDTSRDILHGDARAGDRSKALTTATKEWYGWQNWAHNNGIQVSGDATRLAHHAGSLLGLDSDRINRILKTIDPTSSLPAALHRGGEESCWKKIYRLDKATFEAKCPAHIKDAIVETFRQNVSTGDSGGNGDGGGGGRRGGRGTGSEEDGETGDGDNPNRRQVAVKLPNIEPFDSVAIRNQIRDILIQDLPPSQLQTAKIRIRRAFPGVSPAEIRELFDTLEQELELEESRGERRSEVDNLLKLGDQSLNLREFLPADLAEPLKELAQNLSIRPEVCLTLLLVAASSLHKNQTELVIHRSSGFSVPPTIFAGLVSESGQKKSPILKAIIKKPLSVLQREKREAFQAASAQYEKDIAGWDKCKLEERSSKFPEGKPNKPQQRLYYFTNSTGEGLLYQFQAHPDKALLALVDELVGLFASQNKYSGGRGSDRQDILSAFDGTGATVLRAAGARADIDGLSLSICGTIQPEILKRLMRDCSDPDGQWARFLFVNQPLAAATLSDDDGSGVDLTGRLLSYYRAIDQLPTREYRLSRSAYLRYQPIYNQLERLRVSHPNPGMRAVYSKMEGYIGRLALNFHVLHELAVGKTLPTDEIPLQHIERAIALAKFYIGQVKLIHANCSADLGEMAPHLAKVVELSKRMDATTGNSWIKAKVVQTGYDSRHRPRPTAVRSWFRELEALGIGSTRGTGIRLEYSWKLPDFPFDEPDPPQRLKEEKEEKSGEKWITSPPTEPTQIKGFPEKVEKVDNPTPEGNWELGTEDWELGDVNSNVAGKSCPTPIPNPQSFSSIDDEKSVGAGSPISSLLRQDTEKTAPTSPAGDECLVPQTLESLRDSASAYPLSGCNDGVASSDAVDTISTFHPPVDSVSTTEDCEEPDREIPRDEVGAGSPVSSLRSPDIDKQSHTKRTADSESSGNIQWARVFRVFLMNQHLTELTDSHSRDAGVEVGCTVVESATALPQNPGCSKEYARVLVTVEEFTSNMGLKGTELLALVTAVSRLRTSSFLIEWPLLHSPKSLEAAEPPATVEPSVLFSSAEVNRFKVGDRVDWVNCPGHCERFAPFEITAIDGDYAHLDLFEKPVLLAELRPI